MANIIKRIWNQNRMVQIEDLKGMTFQAEQAGHTFQISGIDDDGNTVALTGTPSGVLLRPDNTDVALTCSVSGGVVSATLPANCYDVPGRFGLTIFITSGSSKTAIYAAVGTVTRASSGTAAPGTTQSVVDLINAINAAVNSIPASYSALLADIAPTYSNSALYSVGQYTWYDGDLKRCIVPITTAESYTAAHWTSAVLGQDVSDLKSAISDSNGNLIWSKSLEKGITEISEQTYNLVTGVMLNTGMESDGSLTPNNAKDIYKAPIVSGKKYTVNTDETMLICSFYTGDPFAPGAKDYSERWLTQYSKTVEAPITGYIAFRTLAGYQYAQIVEGTTNKPYVYPRIAKDTIARESIETVNDKCNNIQEETNHIKSVTIETEVSKNKYNAVNGSFGDSNIKLTCDNQTYKVERLNTITDGATLKVGEFTLPAGTYTLSVQNINWVKAQKGWLGYSYLRYTDNPSVAVCSNAEIGSAVYNSATFTLDEEATIDSMVIIAKSGMYNTMDFIPQWNIQIESGSSVTKWVEYLYEEYPALYDDLEESNKEVDTRTRDYILNKNKRFDEESHAESVFNYLRKIKNEGESIPVVIPTQAAEIEDGTIRVALHKHAQEGTEIWNELFSTDFEEDFSNVRFTDGEGNELPYVILSHGNYDFVKDSNLANAENGMFVLSDGTLVTTKNVRAAYSTDNGATWSNLGTADIPAIVRFVDSNDNVYVENMTFQIVKLSESSSYNTGTVVLDLSATQSHVYTLGCAEDDNGNIYMGQYQSAFDAAIYRSTDGGNTFTKVYENTNVQHVHHITVNHTVTPNEIWAGLDCSTTYYGPVTIVSRDGGTTWTEVDVPYRNRDYAYLFFKDNYMLGGGESNILGGPTAYKATKLSDGKTHYDTIIETAQGVRSINSPKDGIICVGGCSGGTNLTEQIYVSYDDACTFKTAFMNDMEDVETASAGSGCRWFTPYMIPRGASEAQMIGSGFDRRYGLRCFFGGERHYAVAEVKVGNVTTAGKTIYCKTGYAISVSNIEEVSKEPSNLIYELKTDGEKIITTTGNAGEKHITFEEVDTVGYGETIPTKTKDFFGIKFDGKIALPNLNFSSIKNKTISMTLKQADRKTAEDSFGTELYVIDSEDFSIYLKLVHKLSNSGVGIFVKYGDETVNVVVPDTFWHSYELYRTITLTFSNDALPTMKIYVDEERKLPQYQDATFGAWDSTVNLKNETVYLGYNGNADGKETWKSGISSIRVYDGCLSHAEIVSALTGKTMVK